MSILFEYLDDQIYCHHSYNADPKKLQFYMHMHERMELFYFISGDVDYIVERSTYHLSPGDIVITHSAESHMPVILSSLPYERISIQFDPRVINSIDHSGILMKPFHDRSLGNNNHYSNIQSPIEDITGFLDQFDLYEFSEIKRLKITTVLLSCLVAVSQRFNNLSLSERFGDGAELSGQLINYVNQELFTNISISSISQHFFISESQVNRIFKKVTGYPVWKYVQRKRLTAAREKILSGEKALVAASNCGFHDYSTFYRAYTNMFSVTPSSDISRKKQSVLNENDL